MIATTMLDPHDPVPEGPERQVIVLRRLDEDSAAKTTIEIILTGSVRQTTHPTRPDGTPMHLDEAIAAARKVATEEGLDRVLVVDRAQGRRERDILSHDGDHSIHMNALQDENVADGDRGADMRDIAHPVPGSE